MADEAKGYITPRASWPRPAAPSDLKPAWAGEFNSFEDWVSFARTRLTGTYDPLMKAEIPSVCVDNIGRRCTMGGHFARARDEGTFPVRFFWDCEPAAVAPGLTQAEQRAQAARCSCGGSDDNCPCQNSPDPLTLAARAGSCINHPDRPTRENLDGDNLCQECCDAWARAEGHAAADAEAREREGGPTC